LQSHLGCWRGSQHIQSLHCCRWWILRLATSIQRSTSLRSMYEPEVGSLQRQMAIPQGHTYSKQTSRSRPREINKDHPCLECGSDPRCQAPQRICVMMINTAMMHTPDTEGVVAGEVCGLTDQVQPGPTRHKKALGNPSCNLAVEPCHWLDV